MPRNTKLLYYYMYFSLLFIFKSKQALKNVGIIFEQYSFDYIRHESKYSMAFNELLFSNQVHRGKLKQF